MEQCDPCKEIVLLNQKGKKTSVFYKNMFTPKIN